MSAIFERFVQGELTERRRGRTKGARRDFNTGQVWTDDQEVTLKLGEAQRTLVRFLYRRSGAACTYDDIAEEVSVWAKVSARVQSASW